ncbi:hypothetical protein GBA52_010566 [Prunus armeniaca]|nr:hypothetical protein GBA52_010566 [Prunus armeniaca]
MGEHRHENHKLDLAVVLIGQNQMTAVCMHDPISTIGKIKVHGEDLDALIFVTNDKDLDHMIIEYDRLYCSYTPTTITLTIVSRGTTINKPF